MNMHPILHLISWIVFPVFIIFFIGPEFFWFASIGSFVFLLIIYHAFAAWSRFPLAAFGLIIAVASNYIMLGVG